MYPYSLTMLNNLMAGKRQTARIIYTSQTIVDGQPTTQTVTLTEADIRQGGLKIDRQCPLGIGSAVAAEMDLTLYNPDGNLNDLINENGYYEVYVGTKDWDDPTAELEEIPMGVFVTDVIPAFAGKTIHIKALDRMVLFDKVVTDWSSYTFPMNIVDLVETLCALAGNVTCVLEEWQGLSNKTYSVNWNSDFSKVTLRTILRWCCFILGANAYMNWNGALAIREFDRVTSDRTPIMYNSVIYRDSFSRSFSQVTGFEYTYSNGVTAILGSPNYILKYPNCPINDHSENTVVNDLYFNLISTNVANGTIETYSMPYLWASDVIQYRFNQDSSFQTVLITGITYTINRHSVLSSVCDNARVQENRQAAGAANSATTLTESDVLYVKQLIANAIAANNL